MLRMGNNQVCICNRRQLRRRKSERKASTTLGIIVGAFIVCWLPFFMLALIRPFYKPDAIPHSVSSLFLWLGYCNSALNPIIYAIFNKEIRKPFILVMCLRWRNINEFMREEYYQRQFGERRTRNDVNGGNDGTENTERADLVDDNNLNIGPSNQNTDNNDQNYNNNQNVDNNNRDVDRNPDISNNNQDVADNNHDVDDNNQDVSTNKQDSVNNRKQDLDDNKIIVDKNQIIIDIVEESRFWSKEYSSNNEDRGIQRRSSSYCMDIFQVVAEIHAPCITETLVWSNNNVDVRRVIQDIFLHKTFISFD